MDCGRGMLVVYLFDLAGPPDGSVSSDNKEGIQKKVLRDGLAVVSVHR